MPDSRAQVRAAYAAQEGKGSMDPAFAREVIGKVEGKPGSVKALPERAGGKSVLRKMRTGK